MYPAKYEYISREYLEIMDKLLYMIGCFRQIDDLNSGFKEIQTIGAIIRDYSITDKDLVDGFNYYLYLKCKTTDINYKINILANLFIGAGL